MPLLIIIVVILVLLALALYVTPMLIPDAGIARLIKAVFVVIAIVLIAERAGLLK